MTRVLIAIGSFLAACASAPSSTPAVAGDAEPIDGCWRPHLPVVTCDRPVHPELVGLWGMMTTYSSAPVEHHSLFVYDGCTVTIAFGCPFVGDRGSRTMEAMTREVQFAGDLNERSALGISEHRHHGRAHRTHAVWRGDTLVSVSEVSIDIEVARVVPGADGLPTFVYVRDTRRPVSLVRYDPSRPLDAMGRELLCARGVVRRPGEWREIAERRRR